MPFEGGDQKVEVIMHQSPSTICIITDKQPAVMLYPGFTTYLKLWRSNVELKLKTWNVLEQLKRAMWTVDFLYVLSHSVQHDDKI